VPDVIDDLGRDDADEFGGDRLVAAAEPFPVCEHLFV
jgi:hypothetical protein